MSPFLFVVNLVRHRRIHLALDHLQLQRLDADERLLVMERAEESHRVFIRTVEIHRIRLAMLAGITFLAQADEIQVHRLEREDDVRLLTVEIALVDDVLRKLVKFFDLLVVILDEELHASNLVLRIRPVLHREAEVRRQDGNHEGKYDADANIDEKLAVRLEERQECSEFLEAEAFFLRFLLFLCHHLPTFPLEIVISAVL